MMDEIHDANVTESHLTDRFPLQIYQDPHELKKRRNRLAQRKHRQRLTSTGSSATRKRQCVPEPAVVQLPTPERDEISTRYLSENFTGFENGGSDSSMGFSLPTSSRNGGQSRQTSPELEQFISRMWQPNFDALGTGCLPDVAMNSPGSYMQCSTMAYGSSGFPSQHEVQISRIRDNAGSMLPIPGVVLMQQQQLPTLIHGNTSKASTDILDSPRTDPEMTNGAALSNHSPKQNLSSPPSRSFSHHQQSSPSICGQNIESLETKFERVMKAIEQSGFKSIDDMAVQYYTAAFREDTTPFWAQSRSRSRSFPRLLASLHESTKTWATRDIESYKQQVTNLAEDIYVGELSTAKQNICRGREKQHQEEIMSANEQGDRIVENLWAAISDIEISQELKDKKAIIRENMPELWSLLVELTRKADLCQPRGSQAVGAFLLLLGCCLS